MTIDVLQRLDPDALYPARLAGPHAWARWGLAPRPTPDAPVHLVVPANAPAGSVERIFETIDARLRRPAWPPRPDVEVERRGSSFAVSCGGARATIEVAPTLSDGEVPDVRVSGDVVDGSGWFIIDEVDALRERLAAIGPAGPCQQDCVDLARWAALKGEQVRVSGPSVTSVATSLADLRHRAPQAYRGLREALDSPQATATAVEMTGRLRDGLRYLRGEVDGLDRAVSTRSLAR